MNPVLFVELAFSWKRNIAKIVIEYYIHKKMLLSFENTPVGLTFLNKTTWTNNESESVPIINTVGLSGKFLPIQKRSTE